MLLAKLRSSSLMLIRGNWFLVIYSNLQKRNFNSRYKTFLPLKEKIISLDFYGT